MPGFPVYRFDPSLAFPELGSFTQSTDECVDKASALSTTLAYLLSGHKFRGSLADMTIEQIYAEIEQAADGLRMNMDRLMTWAESLLIPPEEPGDISVIPTFIESKNFTLHPYQVKVAAWSAHRMGSIEALGCGVGKSATSTAAAIGAARLGRCSTKRCTIICPLNAMGQWEPYTHDLRKVFKEVIVLSCDSLHKFKSEDPVPGGAIIFDEVHKLKNFTAQRTGHAHMLRLAYEWGVCLTGTLLHTGPEALLSIMNLACPGMARYMDPWSFGKDYDCVIVKKVGPRKKRSLGIPSKRVRDKFSRYLARAVRSRSFDSEDVKAVVQVPDQDRILVDTWEKPEWIRDDEKKIVSDARAKGDPVEMAKFSDADLTIHLTPYLWPPDTEWKTLMAASAVALMNKDRREYDAKVLTKEIDPAVIPTPGMPTFARVLHFVSKMGCENVIIMKMKDEKGEVKTYDFVHPNPEGPERHYGPKLDWIAQWLLEHPGEPVVIGAAAVRTLDLLQEMLKECGIEYQLIRGGVPANDRTKFIADFQAGKFQVMLLQQVAGSESVTLTEAANSILLDHDWNPITYTQFLARTCRIGQDEECDHYDLSFNAIQTEIIKKLVRGEAFDAEARAELEKQIGEFHV